MFLEEQPRLGKSYSFCILTMMMLSADYHRGKMGLLQTVHQTAFRAAQDEPILGIGWMRKVGEGAGVYTFISVDEAGHCELFFPYYHVLHRRKGANIEGKKRGRLR